MRLFSRLFGDDIFISYSRRDGSLYAAGLADELTEKNLSCFIDKLGVPPDHDLPADLIRKIKNSSIFVIVGTEKAARSSFVQKEIRAFKETGRTILPIDFSGNIASAVWYEDIPGLAVETEKDTAAMEKGDPSDNVIRFIEKSFNYTRRNQHMARMLWGGISAFVILIALGAGSFLFAHNQAEIQRKAAAKARDEAASAKDEAAQSKNEAEAAKKETEAAKRETDSARLETEKARTRANAENLRANKAADLATEKTLLAEREARRAKAAQQLREIAEDETKAQKRVATEYTARNYFHLVQRFAAPDPDQGLLWAQHALNTAPERQKEIPLYGMRLLHMTRDYLTDRITNLSETLMVDEQLTPLDKTITSRNNSIVATIAKGKLKLWDLRNGRQLPLAWADRSIQKNYPDPVFSRNEKYIAFFSRDGDSVDDSANSPRYLEVWNIETGKREISFKGEAFQRCTVSMLSFSPDDRSILANIHGKSNGPDCFGGIVSWQINSSNPAQPTSNPPIPNRGRNFLRSPDPAYNLVVTVEQNYAHIIDVESGENKWPPIAFVSRPNMAIKGNKVFLIREQQDGVKWNQNLIVIDLESRESLAPVILQTSDRPLSERTEFSICGQDQSTKLYLSQKCADGECRNGIYVFDIAEKRLGNRRKPLIELGEGELRVLKVSGGGQFIVTEVSADDDAEGTAEVGVWDANTGVLLQDTQKLRHYGVSLEARTIVLAPQEGRFVTRNLIADDSDPFHEVERRQLTTAPHQVYVFPDEQRFAIVSQVAINLDSKDLSHLEFEEVVGQFDQVSFSQDGLGFRAVNLSVTPAAIQQWRWDVETGRAYREEFSYPQYTRGDVFTKQYDYVVNARGGRLWLSSIADRPATSVELFFNNTNNRNLALALIAQADEVLCVGNIIKLRRGGEYFAIRANGIQGAEILGSDSVRVSFPLGYRDKAPSDLRISPDGKLILIKEGGSLSLVDLRSGELLTSKIWSGVESAFDFSSTGAHVFTMDRTGRLRKHYIGSRRTQYPAWLKNIGGAMTGKQLLNNSVTLISQEAYSSAQRKLVSELERAAVNDDEDARFILEHWIVPKSCRFRGEGCEER